MHVILFVDRSADMQHCSMDEAFGTAKCGHAEDKNILDFTTCLMHVISICKKLVCLINYSTILVHEENINKRCWSNERNK